MARGLQKQQAQYVHPSLFLPLCSVLISCKKSFHLPTFQPYVRQKNAGKGEKKGGTSNLASRAAAFKVKLIS